MKKDNLVIALITGVVAIGGIALLSQHTRLHNVKYVPSTHDLTSQSASTQHVALQKETPSSLSQPATEETKESEPADAGQTSSHEQQTVATIDMNDTDAKTKDFDESTKTSESTESSESSEEVEEHETEKTDKANQADEAANNKSDEENEEEDEENEASSANETDEVQTPATSPQPTAQEQEAQEVETKIKEILELEKIEFQTAKATLTEKGKKTVQKIAQILKDHPQLKIEIAGHTDSVGDDEKNLKLSQRRAEAVKNALVEAGIEPERLIAKGYGETKPLPGESGESQANRRVEFHIVK